jgi:hypothetical protein
MEKFQEEKYNKSEGQIDCKELKIVDHKLSAVFFNYVKG